MTSSWTTAGLDLHVETTGTGQRASLEDGLRSAIQGRRLVAGTLLPSSRALAGDLGIARGTVVAAYDQLVAEGYLVARQGAGTVVADLGPETAAAVEDRRGSDVRLDLRPGTPDVSSFPVSAWLRSTRRAVAAAPARAYGYGDVRGRRELRAALVDYLGRTRGVHAVIDQVMITSGTTQSLSLLAMALRAAGSDAIAMENPGFAMHRPVVQLAGQRVVSVPVDARGVAAHELDDVPAAAIVVTPAHQYPTGVVMHPSRRRALTAWARATGGDRCRGRLRRRVPLRTSAHRLAAGHRARTRRLPRHRVQDAVAGAAARLDGAAAPADRAADRGEAHAPTCARRRSAS